MPHIVVIGAGQLGTTLCILFDAWNRVYGRDFEITLVDSQCEPLSGATRAAWINHASGLEYFNREDEAATGKVCIEGAIAKRLLLPPGLHNLPVVIRNRFFVSDKTAVKDIRPESFTRNARVAQNHYRKLRTEAEGHSSFEGGYWDDPDHFVTQVDDPDPHGVKNVAIGFTSKGGASNMAMDVAFKNAALLKAQKDGTLRERLLGSQVDQLDETGTRVTIKVAGKSIVADYVVCCAAHGNRTLAKLSGQADAQGAYMMNFMLHVPLPATSERSLQDQLASVNFVLQGEEHGAMFACIVPPSDTEAGIAALFAPGYDCSYLHICKNGESPTGWDDIQSKFATFRFDWRARAILERTVRYNPFLKPFEREILEGARPVIGSVFNPRVGLNDEGQRRNVRRLVAPKWSHHKRLLYATSPKWTTVELAALTVMETVLEQCLRRGGRDGLLPKCPNGYGPLKLDIPNLAHGFRMTDVRISRAQAENYLANLGLPLRIICERDEFNLFAPSGGVWSGSR